MHKDRSSGGSIGIYGDVYDRNVGSLREHLSACRSESIDVTGTTTTKTTTSEFKAVNVAFAMELGATGLTGAPAGGGEDEGGDLLHGEVAVKTKHPQDPKLLGGGVLGRHSGS